MFDDRCAAFHKVTGIDIGEVPHRLYFCMMNVATNNSVEALVIKRVDDALLVIGNELHGILDLEFDEGSQRETGLYTEKTTHRPDPAIQLEQDVVSFAPEFCDPLVISGNGVVFIPVHHQIVFAIGGRVDDRVTNLDVSKDMIVVIPNVFVMIPRHVDHPGIVPRFAQDLLNDCVMGLGPVHLFGESPEVDDVSNQVEDIALVILQEVEQDVGLTLSRANMEIRNKDGPVVLNGHHASKKKGGPVKDGRGRIP